MQALKRPVAVLTVGLTPHIRSQLDAQFAPYPEIDLEHLDGWAFRLLQADVVVLNLEESNGEEVREMLRSFQGSKAPLEVTYSESEERMRVWQDVHPISGTATGHESAPRFSHRLQDAVRQAGSYEVVLDDFDAGPRVVAGDPVTPGVASGIRWTD